MKIYVGNLSYNITEYEITTEFSAFGNVESTAIPIDNMSGRPRGFAFVEMGSKSEAEAAISGLNGKMLHERTIVVNEARPREGQGGGYNRGGYGGNRGGGRPGGGKKRRY